MTDNNTNDSLDYFSSFGIKSFGFIPLFQEIASALMSHEPGKGKQQHPHDPYPTSSSMERQRRRSDRWHTEHERDKDDFGIRFASLFEPAVPRSWPLCEKNEYGPRDFYLAGTGKEKGEKEESGGEKENGESGASREFQKDTPDPPFSPRLPSTPSELPMLPNALLCDETNLPYSDDDSDDPSPVSRNLETSLVKAPRYTFLNFPLSSADDKKDQEMRDLKNLVNRLNAHNENLVDKLKEMKTESDTTQCFVSELGRKIKDLEDRLAVQEEKVWRESDYRVLYGSAQTYLKNYINNYHTFFDSLMHSTPTPDPPIPHFPPKGGQSKK